MGSNSSKKKSIVKTAPESLKKPISKDIYDEILSSQTPIKIDSIMTPPIPSNYQSKYIISASKIKSPQTIIDQSGGFPMIFDIFSRNFTSINFPVSPHSRLISISPNSVLLTFQSTCTAIFFPSLKQVPLQSLHKPRINHSIVYFNDKILVTGGENNNLELKSCELFDGTQWENIPDLNFERSWHSSIFHAESVYVFGGLKTNTIEKLKGKWEVINVRLEWNINRIGLAPITNRILVVGGEIIGVGYSVAAWEFDLKNEKLIPTKNCPVQTLFYAQGGYFQNSAIILGLSLKILYDEGYKNWEVLL